MAGLGFQSVPGFYNFSHPNQQPLEVNPLIADALRRRAAERVRDALTAKAPFESAPGFERFSAVQSASPLQQLLVEQPPQAAPMPQPVPPQSPRTMRDFDVPASYLPASMAANPYADGNYLYGFNQSAPLADREFAARERMIADRAPWQPYDDPESRARARAYGGGPALPAEIARAQRVAEAQTGFAQAFPQGGAQTPQSVLAGLLQHPAMQNGELTYSGRLKEAPFYSQLQQLLAANRALPQDQQVDLPALRYTGSDFVDAPEMQARRQEVSARRDAERADRRENVVLAAQARRLGVHPLVLQQIQQQQEQQQQAQGLLQGLLGGQGGDAQGLAAMAIMQGADPSVVLQYASGLQGDHMQQQRRQAALAAASDPNATPLQKILAMSEAGVSPEMAAILIEQPGTGGVTDAIMQEQQRQGALQEASQSDLVGQAVAPIESDFGAFTSLPRSWAEYQQLVSSVMAKVPGMTPQDAAAVIATRYPNVPTTAEGWAAAEQEMVGLPDVGVGYGIGM